MNTERFETFKGMPFEAFQVEFDSLKTMVNDGELTDQDKEFISKYSTIYTGNSSLYPGAFNSNMVMEYFDNRMANIGNSVQNVLSSILKDCFYNIFVDNLDLEHYRKAPSNNIESIIDYFTNEIIFKYYNFNYSCDMSDGFFEKLYTTKGIFDSLMHDFYNKLMYTLLDTERYHHYNKKLYSDVDLECLYRWKQKELDILVYINNYQLQVADFLEDTALPEIGKLFDSAYKQYQEVKKNAIFNEINNINLDAHTHACDCKDCNCEEEE
jgi:hypothetical protein